MDGCFDVGEAFEQWKAKNEHVPLEDKLKLIAKNAVEAFNSTTGGLVDYDCPKCKNRGAFYKLTEKGESWRVVHCECMQTRRELALIRRSGLSGSLNICTFDKFKTESALQKEIKNTALEFVKNYNDKWFFIGGQVGTGKTHICTAIVGELLHSGVPVKYVRWKDVARQLKQSAMDKEAYYALLTSLENVPVLYLDDLFFGKPTEADIGITYELLNFRYAEFKSTIISSEKTTSELLKIDEAVGSRIIQMAEKFCLNIKPDIAKNVRLQMTKPVPSVKWRADIHG